MNRVFDTYSRMVSQMTDVFEQRHPRQDGDPKWVWAGTIRAKACDTVRGLLPVSTLSNVGIYGTGQAYEMSLVRMQSNPLSEVRDYGDMMLGELRKIVPAFLTRVDLEDRGIRWSKYLSDFREDLEHHASELQSPTDHGSSVTLTDWDPEAETKIVAAALYAVSELPDIRLQEIARDMSQAEAAQIVASMVGDRANRRHKPGRAMERTTYRFDVKCDIGAFRDLQRHRLMTLEWQKYTTHLGYDLPDEVAAQGLEDEWTDLMDSSREFYEDVRTKAGARRCSICCPICV